MFTLLRYGWNATIVYGVDVDNDKFLIYENDHWDWAPMDEFKPIF